MAQLMPLPLTVSCFSEIQIGFTFLVPAHLGSSGKRAVKQVCYFLSKNTQNCQSPYNWPVPWGHCTFCTPHPPSQCQWLSQCRMGGGKDTQPTQYTHTHPFNGPISGTTQVSQYQKGGTNLDLTEARDSEWQWHQLGHMQVCNLLQTDNHAGTPPLSFLQAGHPSCCPTNSVKALKASPTQYNCQLLLKVTTGKIINEATT